MTIFKDSYLKEVSSRILHATGMPLEDAGKVAGYMVSANLAGHDSHGVIQTLNYVDRIQKGHLDPKTSIEIRSESPTSAIVDGNWGFGYIVSSSAVEVAIEKAEKNHVAALTILRQGHVGRLANYTTALAGAGMIGLMTSDSGHSKKWVVPFGGSVPCLGTNPISIAVPSNQQGPVFVDMATSVVAQGKIALARSRGEKVPFGWMVDSEGSPSTDPNLFAALLPLGGDQGYKGYGLSFMIEIFAGILTGIGYGIDPSGRHNDGCLLLAVKVDAFRPLEDFKREVDDFISQIKNTPPAKGFEEVLYPGEIEWRTAQQRLKSGIFIEDATWDGLQRLMDDYGIKIEQEG
ncbi:MAG: Ldh family oxidoreductase [Desulfobacteraceae bacterium]|nr:MAG: Ldh family oxidoreductase [Desulfobacteraceae bacterium]